MRAKPFQNLSNRKDRMAQSFEIQWPDHNHPKNCPVHVRNELDMDVPQEHVWAWLIHATLWPAWYENSSQVKILNGSAPILKKGSKFRWKTMGTAVNCTVVEYAPNERIAWSGRAYGVDVYHAWVLAPSSRGCRVLTEETQRGLLASLGKIVLPKQMHKAHQLWLESLEAKAHCGLPPMV